MSLVSAIAALKSTVAGVDGLTGCLVGQPNTPHKLPLAFLEIESGSRTYGAQIVGNVYRIRLSVCVARQGNTMAEAEIAPYVNSVPIAVDNAASIAANMSKVTEWQADYFSWGDPEVMTRRVYFIVEITDKGARGTL